MEEFVAWLNSDRRHREMQYTLETYLPKVRSSHNSQREEAIDELVRLVRGLKDNALEAYLVLQDIQEYNVALAIMKAVNDKEATVPMKVDSLVAALDVLQGCCLLHYPSKGLVGIDSRAIKLMLSRLETFCRMHGGKLVEKQQVNSSSARVPLGKRASSLVETASLDPVVIMSCLDCLLAILVDHDLCQVEFRQSSGIAYLVDVINATSAPKDVRAKSAEFLLFLVRYFTESKDDHQQQVVNFLGEKLAKGLTDAASATGKGAEKFDVFLKMVDAAHAGNSLKIPS